MERVALIARAFTISGVPRSVTPRPPVQGHGEALNGLRLSPKLYQPQGEVFGFIRPGIPELWTQRTPWGSPRRAQPSDSGAGGTHSVSRGIGSTQRKAHSMAPGTDSGSRGTDSRSSGVRSAPMGVQSVRLGMKRGWSPPARRARPEGKAFTTETQRTQRKARGRWIRSCCVRPARSRPSASARSDRRGGCRCGRRWASACPRLRGSPTTPGTAPAPVQPRPMPRV